jgi:hypothetical protein
MDKDNDDLEYIDILVEAGEYEELLKFLIDVLPNTKISVDKVNSRIILEMWKAEEIKSINDSLKGFKSAATNLNLDLIYGKLPKGYIADFKIIDEKKYIDNFYVNNFIEDLKKVGIKLEKWQVEELYTLNYLRNANIYRTRG